MQKTRILNLLFFFVWGEKMTKTVVEEKKERFTGEELAIIFEYDDNREKSREKEEYNIQIAIINLDAIVKDNLKYLKYAEANHWFKMTEEQRNMTALHNALTSIIGRSINWEIGQARKLAFEILEDVNDHEMASKISKVMKI